MFLNDGFESQSSDPFSLNEDLKYNDQDPDVNFDQNRFLPQIQATIFQMKSIKFSTKTIFCPTSIHSQYEKKL